MVAPFRLSWGYGTGAAGACGAWGGARGGPRPAPARRGTPGRRAYRGPGGSLPAPPCRPGRRRRRRAGAPGASSLPLLDQLPQVDAQVQRLLVGVHEGVPAVVGLEWGSVTHAA